jgi:hypothetical protein
VHLVAGLVAEAQFQVSRKMKEEVVQLVGEPLRVQGQESKGQQNSDLDVHAHVQATDDPKGNATPAKLLGNPGGVGHLADPVEHGNLAGRDASLAGVLDASCGLLALVRAE